MDNIVYFDDYRLYLDPVLAPKDQVDRYKRANYSDEKKQAIDTLVNLYQIKLRVILDKLDKREITDEIINLVNKHSEEKNKYYPLYNLLKLGEGDLSLKGLEKLKRNEQANREVGKVVNGSPQDKFTTIVKDDNVVSATSRKASPPKITKLPSSQSFNEMMYESSELSDPEETARLKAKLERIREEEKKYDANKLMQQNRQDPNQARENILQNQAELEKYAKQNRQRSVAPGKKSKMKKGRKFTKTKIIGASLAIIVGICALVANSYDNNHLSAEEANSIIDHAEQQVEMLHNIDIDTPEKYAGLLGQEKDEKKQLHQLMDITIGETKPTPEELIEYYRNPEILHGKTDDINEEIEAIVDNNPSIMDNINDANDEVKGKWKQDVLKEKGKGL